MSRKREEEHLCPLEYFSSHWKHSPFSRRIASSSGVRRLKGTLEEVVRVGVGNRGGLEDDVGNRSCREPEEALAEGRNDFRPSFCFSSCNLAYATAWLIETGCSTWTSRRIAGVRPVASPK